MAKIPAYHPRVPTRTEKAIEAALNADGGARWRGLMQKWLPLIKDAYRQDEDPHRSHFGISSVGRACDRELWLKWRWAAIKQVPARIIRLFNRGHREEACFLALLEMIDVHLHFGAEDGQDRVSAFSGHVGSALDATLYGVPDSPMEWMLGEFKTHNTKSFTKLVADNNLRSSKPEHYAQIQGCMKLRGIYKTLYMAINKNDDDLYCEIIPYDADFADRSLERAGRLVFARKQPPRISDDPSDMGCRMCDLLDVCHYKKPVLRNCRTCQHSVADPAGTWGCEHHNLTLDKEAQKRGCDDYSIIPELDVK